jgi:hypothetical protein
MGISSQFRLGTSIAQLLHTVGDVCDAEGLSATDVQSILFLDDEIEVVIVRPEGSRRHNTYPFALLVAGASRRFAPEALKAAASPARSPPNAGSVA